MANNVSVLNGHVGFKDIPFDYIGSCSLCGEPVADLQKDPLYDTLFAADSTGHPTSIMSVFLEKNTSPEIQAYVSRNLLRPVGDGSSYGSNSDVVLEMLQRPEESIHDYTERMVNIAKGVKTE